MVKNLISDIGKGFSPSPKCADCFWDTPIHLGPFPLRQSNLGHEADHLVGFMLRLQMCAAIPAHNPSACLHGM